MNQAEKQFIFNLQMFNEETSAPSEQSQPEVIQNETPIVQTETKQDFNQMSAKDQANFFEKQFLTPKETPVTVKEPVVEQVIEEPVVVEPVAVVEQAEPTYTPEEIASVGIDKLDPKRLPEAMQPYYKSMLADYTRKTQAIAEQKRQAEQLQQYQKPPEQPKTIDRLRQERLQDITAVEQILNEGNSGERIEYNQFDDDHAYIMKRVSDYRVYNERQQSSVAEANNKLVQREQADPEFSNIVAHAEKELVALAGSSMEGFNMANQILAANQRLEHRQATADDIQLIETFWVNTKTKYKASKTKPITKVVAPAKAPIASENTGTPVQQSSEKPKKFNVNSVAKMDKNQQANLMGVFAMQNKK